MSQETGISTCLIGLYGPLGVEKLTNFITSVKIFLVDVCLLVGLLASLFGKYLERV